MKLLKDKVVVITGASGLLGKEFSFQVLKHGGNVLFTDINFSNEGSFLQIVEKKYPDNFFKIKMDITSEISILSAYKKILNLFPNIDCLVNNAYPRNKNYGAKYKDVNYSNFTENLSMHVGGYFLTTKIFAEKFIAQSFGNIVNVASIYGFFPPRFEIYEDSNITMPIEYASIKSSILQLTKYFAKLFKSNGIRVNALSPGGVKNNQSKVFIDNYNNFCMKKGMLDARDVANVLVFLISDLSMHITGQNIVVDDGFTL